MTRRAARYLPRSPGYVTLVPKQTCRRSQPEGSGRLFLAPGVTVPPRPTLEPGDLVTPSQAGKLLGIPAGRVRIWIHRYGIKSLGMVGRWPVYDYNELAAIDAQMRRQQARAAA